VRLIIQPGTADMSGRGVLKQLLLLHGVLIEPGDRAQPAGDGGAGPAAGFQVPGEALDVRAASLEQVQAMLAAPAGELAQIELIRLAGQAGSAWWKNWMRRSASSRCVTRGFGAGSC
jgi:hypothetical protein